MASTDGSGRYEALPTDETAAVTIEGGDLDSDSVGALSFNPHEHNQESCFKFVESSYFQVASACVITFNTITVFLEADNSKWKSTLFVPDQTTLCFYITELFCRVCFFGKYFICGPAWFISWNVLDISVVSAGIMDQWVLPFMPIDKDSPLFAVILIFRMLRLVRVMKIMRIFLETDLSWTEQPKFQSFIGGVIGFNALLMGMETDIKWTGWFYIEQVLLVIYVFELCVRLKRHGLEFMSCYNPDITWNVLDFMIVVSSAIDSWLMPAIKILGKMFMPKAAHVQKAKGMKLSQVMMLMRMLRLMRILRLVKLVKSVRPLYILVTGVLAAFQGVAWVLVLTVVTLYAAGILATRLLGHGLLFPPGFPVPESAKVFKTVPDSMFTLFRVMSGAESDEESHAIDSLMETLPSVKFAFIFFMVTSSWTLLSILTAVVSDNMISTTGQQIEELKIASDEEDRAEATRELLELFDTMDAHHNGFINEKNVVEFLQDPDNALKTAKCCGVATRNVVAVLKTLAPDGQPVKMEDFVECMLDAGKPVTEQSLMKIETLFEDSQRHVDEGCKALAGKVDGFRNRVKAVQTRQAGNVQLDSWNNGHRNLALGKPVMEKQVINGLVAQQKKNSEGITKLHESVQALLRSQEALRQQNIFNNSRKAKLEADLSGLEERNIQAFSGLHESVEALKEDLYMISMVPSSPGCEATFPADVDRIAAAEASPSVPDNTPSEFPQPACSRGFTFGTEPATWSAPSVASTAARPGGKAPTARAPEEDLKRLLALRGKAKLSSLPGNVAEFDGLTSGVLANGRRPEDCNGPPEGLSADGHRPAEDVPKRDLAVSRGDSAGTRIVGG